MLGPPGYFAVTTPSVVTVSPCMPEASPVPWISAIVNSSGSALTVMSNWTESVAAVGVAESVTVAVTVDVPAVVGVPPITPSLVSERPAGRPVMSQLYGEVPPLGLERDRRDRQTDESLDVGRVGRGQLVAGDHGVRAGLAAPVLKSLALWSVSASGSVRCADRAFAGASLAVTFSNDAEFVAAPTRSMIAGFGVPAVTSPSAGSSGVVVLASQDLPAAYPQCRIVPVASGAGSATPFLRRRLSCTR